MPGLPTTISSKETIDKAFYFNKDGNFIGAEKFIINIIDFLLLNEDYTMNFLIFKIII